MSDLFFNLELRVISDESSDEAASCILISRLHGNTPQDAGHLGVHNRQPVPLLQVSLDREERVSRSLLSESRSPEMLYSLRDIQRSESMVDITARLEKPTYYGRNDHDFKIKFRKQKTDMERIALLLLVSLLGVMVTEQAPDYNSYLGLCARVGCANIPQEDCPGKFTPAQPEIDLCCNGCVVTKMANLKLWFHYEDHHPAYNVAEHRRANNMERVVFLLLASTLVAMVTAQPPDHYPNLGLCAHVFCVNIAQKTVQEHSLQQGRRMTYVATDVSSQRNLVVPPLVVITAATLSGMISTSLCRISTGMRRHSSCNIALSWTMEVGRIFQRCSMGLRSGLCAGQSNR
ncbi:hypothetical protein ANN_20896 [Periplaneta americana]|uniref:Uncharacterized protein n=1 Tax=Periplaneta americana TaxID=6978 RepID=A0ABQ8SEB5_PERAM|nr:hypothetical protein ANN_20896 [Periplaneta americana]